MYREEDGKAYYAPEYVKKIINNSHNERQFLHYGSEVYGLEDFTALITIQQDGTHPNGAKKWRKFGKINDRLKEPTTLNNLTEQAQQVEARIQTITIKELYLSKGFKNTDATKMETLSRNTEYTIVEMAKIQYKTKLRFYFKVQGDDIIYLANDFLADYLNNTENKLLLKFKTLDFATTPSRHKALDVRPTATDKKKKCGEIALSR